MKIKVLILFIGFFIGIVFQMHNDIGIDYMIPFFLLSILLIGFFSGIYVNILLKKISKRLDQKIHIKDTLKSIADRFEREG